MHLLKEGTSVPFVKVQLHGPCGVFNGDESSQAGREVFFIENLPHKYSSVQKNRLHPTSPHSVCEGAVIHMRSSRALQELIASMVCCTKQKNEALLILAVAWMS